MRTETYIPARLESSRLPYKPLRIVRDRAMLYWPARNCKALKPTVLTDNPKVFEACRNMDIPAKLDARKGYKNGTERIAGYIARMDPRERPDIVVNLQCDEIDVTPRDISRAVEAAQTGTVATLACPLLESELHDHSVIKVEVRHGCAASFVRYAKTPADAWRLWNGGAGNWFHHVGIYAYPVQLLLDYPTFSPSENEKKLNLEQLRLLDRGYKIAVKMIPRHVESVNTDADLRRVNQAFESECAARGNPNGQVW